MKFFVRHAFVAAHVTAILPLEKDSPEYERGYRSKVWLSNGEAWSSTSNAQQLRVELANALASQIPEPPPAPILRVVLPVSVGDADPADVQALTDYIESGKPYTTKAEREALARVLKVQS